MRLKYTAAKKGTDKRFVSHDRDATFTCRRPHAKPALLRAHGLGLCPLGGHLTGPGWPSPRSFLSGPLQEEFAGATGSALLLSLPLAGRNAGVGLGPQRSALRTWPTIQGGLLAASCGGRRKP